MTRDERILTALKTIDTVSVDLKNDSAKHAGHIEHMGGVGHTGDTHYKLKIVSNVFKGLSRVERQRMIYDLLATEFKTGLHALELKTLTPEENKPEESKKV